MASNKKKEPNFIILLSIASFIGLSFLVIVHFIGNTFYPNQWNAPGTQNLFFTTVTFLLMIYSIFTIYKNRNHSKEK